MENRVLREDGERHVQRAHGDKNAHRTFYVRQLVGTRPDQQIDPSTWHWPVHLFHNAYSG